MSTSIPSTAVVRVGVLLATLLAGTPGCWDDRCGPGQELAEGVCFPIPDVRPFDAGRETATDDAELSDAGLDDAAASGDASADADTGLGKVCTSQGECTGAADFCAIQPGTSSGYCTYQGCTVNGSDCPAEYTCVDLSMYLPGLTACLKV